MAGLPHATAEIDPVLISAGLQKQLDGTEDDQHTDGAAAAESSPPHAVHAGAGHIGHRK